MSDYVTIDNAGNEAIADMIKQRLDQDGIPCVLVPSNIVSVAGAGASYAVTVPADRAEEARALLAEPRRPPASPSAGDRAQRAREQVGDRLRARHEHLAAQAGGLARADRGAGRAAPVGRWARKKRMRSRSASSRARSAARSSARGVAGAGGVGEPFELAATRARARRATA